MSKASIFGEKKGRIGNFMIKKIEKLGKKVYLLFLRL
jgi:hypothetical protein